MEIIRLTPFLLAFIPLVALSQTSSVNVAGAQRPCMQEDLIGHTYKMVLFSETPKRREARWNEQFPYQYISFRPLNVYASVATGFEVTSPKLLNAYLSPMKGYVMRYLLSNEGVLTLLENDVIKNVFRCTAVLKDSGSYVKGDVVMNGYTRKAKSVLYKLYRRWY